MQIHTQALKFGEPLLKAIASRTIMRLLDFSKSKSLSSLDSFSSEHQEVEPEGKNNKTNKPTDWLRREGESA